MSIQTFPPMTNDFPSFDCDAHIAEPVRIWERDGRAFLLYAATGFSQGNLDAVREMLVCRPSC